MNSKDQKPVVKDLTSKVQKAGITLTSLGNDAYKKTYGLKYAYISGAMVRGIASTAMVIAMGKSGMMGYFGTGGLDMSTIESAIKDIQAELGEKPYGMNFLHNAVNPDAEESLTDLLLKYHVNNIEAAAFMGMTPALVRYKLAGLTRSSDEIGRAHV